MKHLTSILIAIISCLGFFACNEASDKKAEKSKTEIIEASSKGSLEACTGIENLLIIDDSAFAMMARFDSIYKKIKTSNPLTYLINSAWIDAMLINSYANFFETSAGKAYDGVRIVNGATNNHTDSRILLVPTKPGADTLHTDVWGTGIILPETTNSTEFQDWQTNQTEASTLKDNFYTIYRKARGLPRDKDPLSESIWMSKCVYIYLREQIKNPANKIDGIRVYMGAYGKMMGTVPGQIDPNQSTILLVPTTKSVTGEHTDRWDLLRPAKVTKKKYDALNHGELCPTKCN